MDANLDTADAAGVGYRVLACPPTHLPLAAVLDLSFLARLPLHVARVIGAAGTQGRDVVDDVAGTRTARIAVRGAWMLLHERGTLRGVALPRASIGTVTC
jgi:hypothetical protein